MKNIEVEFWAKFSEEKHKQLFSFLHKNGKDLGKDDKDIYFFLFPDKNLKVVNQVAKKNAKIVLKLNKIGLSHSFKEIEIPIFLQPPQMVLKMAIHQS